MVSVRRFKAGERYSKKDIKLILQDIRRSLGISGVAKATDLGSFFKLILTTIKSPVTGKLEKGFRLDPL